MKRLIYFVLVGLLVGCNALTVPTVVPSPTPILCLGLTLVDDLLCTQVDETNGILQSQGSEAVTVKDGEFELTMRGIVQLRRFDDRLVINALEGNIVVTVSGSTRVLRGRQTIQLAIVDGVIQPPEGVAEALSDDDLTQIAIERTPQPSATATMEGAESTAEASANPNSTPDATEEADSSTSIVGDLAVTATRPNNIRVNIDEDCEPRAAWRLTYTVVAGDVLEFIARDYGTTVQEMAIANCLENPGLLIIGQILRVPRERPTLTPNTIVFQADAETIENGDCTTIRWNAFNAQEVYIDGELTTLINTRRICPATTTSYRLRVVYRDDSEVEREVRITVNQ